VTSTSVAATDSAMRFAHRWVGPQVARLLRAQATGVASVPAEGGVLLAANHRSFLDHYLLAAVLHRPMRFLGKMELARGAFGRFNQMMGMVAIERGTADLGMLDTIADLLRAGDVMGIFPEGTRSATGELYRFRSGMARIAAAAQVPTVPVGLIGTAQVWPRHSRPALRRPAPGVMRVNFGSVVPPPTTDPGSRRAFTQQVHDAVAELCEQPINDSFAPIAKEGTGT